jgi:hypothetical protein
MQFVFASGANAASEFNVNELSLKSNIVVAGCIQPYEESTLADTLAKASGNTPIITSINAEKSYYYTPNGTKMLLAMNNDGSTRGIKAIPSKTVFIGNSLLNGWSTFGMAASDNEHDYFYYVKEKIKEYNANATFIKTGNANLEHATTNAEFDAAWNAISSAYLTSDVELICIQLGDNVNTPEKQEQFETYSFYTMIDWIYENCPNARLVWVGTWYQSIHSWLKKACWKKGVQLIDISNLFIPINKSTIGQLIHRTSDIVQTLEGSYSVNLGALNITVTILNNTYNLTIPSYTSVVNNGDGTFTVTSPYYVIDTPGVASHPGDAGMIAIANRICKELDLIYQEGDIIND